MQEKRRTVCFTEEMKALPSQFFPPFPSLWTPSAAITSLPSTSVNRTSKACELDGERQCLHLVCGQTRLLQSVRLRPVPKCLSRLKAIVLAHLRSLHSSLSWNCFCLPQIWVKLRYSTITWRVCERVGKHSYGFGVKQIQLCFSLHVMLLFCLCLCCKVTFKQDHEGSQPSRSS